MMRLILLALAMLVPGATVATPARADTEFAYCSIAGFGVGQDCSFRTLEQCQSKVRGTGTDCERNPRFVRPSTGAPAASTPMQRR